MNCLKIFEYWIWFYYCDLVRIFDYGKLFFPLIRNPKPNFSKQKGNFLQISTTFPPHDKSFRKESKERDLRIG